MTQQQAITAFNSLIGTLRPDISQIAKAALFDLGAAIDAPGYMIGNAQTHPPKPERQRQPSAPKQTAQTGTSDDGKLTADRVIAELRRHPAGITQASLAATMSARPATLGTILKRSLLPQGLVREHDGKWYATAAASNVTNVERAGPPKPRAETPPLAGSEEEQQPAAAVA